MNHRMPLFVLGASLALLCCSAGCTRLMPERPERAAPSDPAWGRTQRPPASTGLSEQAREVEKRLGL